VTAPSRIHQSCATRGYRAYAKLMRTVLEEPICTALLAEKHNLMRNSVAEIMRRLCCQGVVHIERWDRFEGRGNSFHEVWAFGPGVNAVKPATVGGTPSLRKVADRLPLRSQIFNFGLLMVALREGHDARSIVDLVGLDRRHLDELLKFMKSIGLVHITTWYLNDVGSPSPVFRSGDKRNAPRPKPRGEEGKSVRYRSEVRRRDDWCSLLHLSAAPITAAAHP